MRWKKTGEAKNPKGQNKVAFNNSQAYSLFYKLSWKYSTSTSPAGWRETSQCVYNLVPDLAPETAKPLETQCVTQSFSCAFSCAEDS